MKKANYFALVGFLTQIRQHYGNSVEKVSYDTLSKVLTNGKSMISYNTIRLYALECEKLGLIQIANKGGRNQIITIIDKAVNDYMGVNE